MSSGIIRLGDHLTSKDTLRISVPKKSKTAPLFRTEILGGYDLIERKNGKSMLGEVLFEEENMTVLGGALYTLEKLFGVQSSLDVGYLNDIMGIANTGTPITDIYPKDNIVCLFGVGTGGSGDTIASVNDVLFQEREVVDMIPFRVTSTPLTSPDDTKYWFKKANGDGTTSYFLKNFESTPTIKAFWDDGVNGEDGTEVQSGVWDSTSTTPIFSFVEIILKITKDDCREWFQINGNPDQARVNTIGLFTGVQGTLADSSVDYKQVKLFSKLNINNEMLTTAKDLTIIYRIYTS